MSSKRNDSWIYEHYQSWKGLDGEERFATPVISEHIICPFDYRHISADLYSAMLPFQALSCEARMRTSHACQQGSDIEAIPGAVNVQ